MNPFDEFAAILVGADKAASTRRLYLGAARRAVEISGKTPDNCGSYGEILALLREMKSCGKLPKSLRIAPFLRFLDGKLPGARAEIIEYSPIRTWVIDRIEEETRVTREASHVIRRDLAMLACLCLAPEKGSPRHWSKSVLSVARKGGGFAVKLWDKAVEPPGLALALLYWHSWRERLDRPEQSRLHRKAWALSDLLFPNSKGKTLKKQAMHDALSRLSVQGEGRVRLTPGRVREAFLNLRA
jgi:hypothetical protein